MIGETRRTIPESLQKMIARTVVKKEDLKRMLPRFNPEYFPKEKLAEILVNFETMQPRVTKQMDAELLDSGQSELAICFKCAQVYEVTREDPVCYISSKNEKKGPFCYSCARKEL